MRIVIDAMSGDNAPFEIVKGALEASKLYDVNIVLTGKKDVIENIADELGYSLDGVEIIDTDVVITMEDDPNSVVRAKKNSSMSLGLYELKAGADAFVTAGNTGAMFVGASLIVRPVKGIRRPCLATILPFPQPVLLLDCGANVNVLPEYLETWACMGSLYMEKIMKIENPRVGLLNNGAEEHKGTPTMVETHQKLKASKEFNFIGNIEARDIPFGACDVLVTDGFTGNIVLKYTEGFGKFFMKTLKKLYSKNTRSKLSFLAMKDQIMDLRRQFDAGEYGGAPLLGLSKPVIKAHGSADAKDIKNAIRVAIAFAETGVVEEIGAAATRTLAARNAENKENNKEETSENNAEASEKHE